MHSKNPEKITTQVVEARKRTKGLMDFLYGYIYDFNDMLDLGAVALGGRFEKIYWILKTLGNVKYYKKISLGEILRNEQAGEYIRNSFLLLAKLVDKNIETVKKRIKEQSDNKNKDKKETKTVKGFKLESYICRDWKQMEEDDADFDRNYASLALKKCIPESEKKVKGWLRKKNRIPGFLGDKERENPYHTLMASLMGGDIHLFLKVMTEFVVNKEDAGDIDTQIMRTADLAKSTYKMMDMPMKKFES